MSLGNGPHRSHDANAVPRALSLVPQPPRQTRVRAARPVNHALLPGVARARLPSAMTVSLRASGSPLDPVMRDAMAAGLGRALVDDRGVGLDPSEAAADRMGRTAPGSEPLMAPPGPVVRGAEPDLRDVRIHGDDSAARSATAAGALAYTLGRDVVFGPGQYAPGTPIGRALLGHELAHVRFGDGTARIQRAAMAFDPAAIALQLRDAMEGLGTDELTIYAALAGRDQAQDDAIAAAYLQLTGRTLSADLQDELSSGELLTLGAVAPEALPTAEAKAQAVAIQLHEAMTGLGTNEAAIYAALSGRSPTELDAIKAAYLQLTQVELETDLRDELSGDELQQGLGTMGIEPTVYEQNTELSGLSVGNFDFHLRDGRILVWVWLRFQFTDNITTAEQAAFKQRLITAVHNRWAHTGYGLVGGAACPTPSIPIEVHVQENTGGFYHKLVDVERKTDEQRRPKVISDINVNLFTNDDTLGHEFGHVLGLYDEYDGPFFENIMFWHKNVPGDTQALMYSGQELRPRYFEQYRRRVQTTAPPGCVYTISSSVPPGP